MSQEERSNLDTMLSYYQFSFGEEFLRLHNQELRSIFFIRKNQGHLLLEKPSVLLRELAITR